MAAARHPRDGATGAAADALERFVRGGLALLGLEATEAEMAVIQAVDGIYRPATDRLIGAELDGVEPEPGTDMGRPPR
jgi:hypothetical protein